MSEGNAPSEGVLAHDSWNERETTFPPGSFVTTPELREAVLQWAFGAVVPPPVIGWRRTRVSLDRF
jgi:hypothetical protein